jgi:hypothetical protein
MTTNAARFKIQGTASENAVTGNRYYIAAHLENCAITLEQALSPALTVTYEVYSSASPSPDQPLASKGAANLVFVESGTKTVILTAVNNTVHLIMPAADVASWVVRCTAAMPEGPHVFERTIAIPLTVPAVGTVRKTTPAETLQYEARGWSDTLNDMVSAIAGIGAFANMDETYNTFGANPAVVVVDNAQGQGDLRFNPVGAFSICVDLTGTTGVVDGFQVYDTAGDYFRLLRVADGRINLDTDLQSFQAYSDTVVIIESDALLDLSCSAGPTVLEGEQITIEATSTFIDIDATTTINIDAGTTFYAGSATTLQIDAGSTCEILSGTSMTLDVGTTFALDHTQDATITPAGNTSVNIELSSCTGAGDGFQILNGADFVTFNRTAADKITVALQTAGIGISHDVDFTVDPAGTTSVSISLAACTGAADGFMVGNGADSFTLLRADANKIAADLTCETVAITSATTGSIGTGTTLSVTAGSQLNLTSSGADMLLTTPGNTVDFASLAAVNSAEAATHYVAMKVSGVLYHFLLATPPA